MNKTLLLTVLDLQTVLKLSQEGRVGLRDSPGQVIPLHQPSWVWLEASNAAAFGAQSNFLGLVSANETVDLLKFPACMVSSTTVSVPSVLVEAVVTDQYVDFMYLLPQNLPKVSKGAFTFA